MPSRAGKPVHRAGNQPRSRPPRHHPGRRRPAAGARHAGRPGRRAAARAARAGHGCAAGCRAHAGCAAGALPRGRDAGGDLDAAVTAGVLEVDDGRLRFSHPLLASAVLAAIRPPGAASCTRLPPTAPMTRRKEHVTQRAAAGTGLRRQIAAGLDEAARMAELRGAPATAAELLELAVSVTPATPRTMRTGGMFRRKAAPLAGETRAAQAVWNDLAAGMPPGPNARKS